MLRINTLVTIMHQSMQTPAHPSPGCVKPRHSSWCSLPSFLIACTFSHFSLPQYNNIEVCGFAQIPCSRRYANTPKRGFWFQLLFPSGNSSLGSYIIKSLVPLPAPPPNSGKSFPMILHREGIDNFW